MRIKCMYNIETLYVVQDLVQYFAGLANIEARILCNPTIRQKWNGWVMNSISL